jgi:hypothetical protein
MASADPCQDAGFRGAGGRIFCLLLRGLETVFWQFELRRLDIFFGRYRSGYSVFDQVTGKELSEGCGQLVAGDFDAIDF